MSKGRASISKGHSYQEIGDFWDEHDLSDVWDETSPAEIEVDLKSERHYFPLERTLSQRVTEIARTKGISPETLVNLWIQEKVESREP